MAAVGELRIACDRPVAQTLATVSGLVALSCDLVGRQREVAALLAEPDPDWRLSSEVVTRGQSPLEALGVRVLSASWRAWKRFDTDRYPCSRLTRVRIAPSFWDCSRGAAPK